MSVERIRRSVADARSTDDLVDGGPVAPVGWQEDLDSPLDRETLDEQASTQMGRRWEPRRRGAN